MSFIKRHVAALERRYADKPWFFYLYAAPYHGLVQRELRLAEIGPNDVVLSIGCGALPFTAVLCARFTGARVIAVDIDPEAVRKARALITSLGMAEQVSVIMADAAFEALPHADVALVALQAAPKNQIRRNLQRSLPAKGGRVVYRLPRHGLESQYGCFDDFDELHDSVGAVRHFMPTFDRSVLCVEQSAVAAILFTHGLGSMSLRSWFFSGVVRCEHVAGQSRVLGAVYSRLFYREMVRRECATAGLQPGARVLQLGSGPFPITAIALAKQGCDVTAVDNNPNSLEHGRRAAELHAPLAGYAGSITFRRADGLWLSYAGYDAVILALHIEPKKDVLKRIIDTATPGTRIVYRNPRSALRGAYRRVTPGELGLAQVGSSEKLPGNKEMVLLRVPATRTAAEQAGLALACGDCNGNCEECLLSNLTPQRSATITSTPHDPMLAALGMRPGKVCSLVAVQPWGGPLVCLVGDRQVAITRALAAQIAVAPLPDAN